MFRPDPSKVRYQIYATNTTKISQQGLRSLRIKLRFGIRLTLRQVATSLPGLGAAPVYLCENPAVVAAAADALGARSAPLVCTSGVPNSAVVALVDALHRAGSRVVIHADFDWAGVRIVAAAVDRWEATPWRFGEADYRVASVRAAASLVGHAAPTPWDPPLADALMAAQVAVHEELVLEDLVGDLDGS